MYVKNELVHCNRIDIVWDEYREQSIKGSTREKRGTGIWWQVNSTSKIPSQWMQFLRDAENKKELLSFLSNQVRNHGCPKEIIMTYGQSTISSSPASPVFQDCNHEEADTRVMVHIFHAAQHGHRKFYVRTVDTDILIILLGQMYFITNRFPDIQIFIAFGVGRAYQLLNVTTIYENLGTDTCRALLFFHALTGCDSTSAFHGRGKKTAWQAWQAWKAFPQITHAFIDITNQAFNVIEPDGPEFQLIEQYVIILYDRTSTITAINEARQELFCKSARSLDNIPPTKDSLILHVSRAAYQAWIWINSLEVNTIYQ